MQRHEKLEACSRHWFSDRMTRQKEHRTGSPEHLILALGWPPAQHPCNVNEGTLLARVGAPILEMEQKPQDSR